MAKTDITAEKLRSLVDYNPETGIFTRKFTGHGMNAGEVVGNESGGGYFEARIGNCRTLLHRFAWLFVYGKWPALNIDHIDGNGKNNAIANLRDVSQQINTQNTRNARTNNKSSGVLGVHRNGKNWAAHIKINGKILCLGTYPTIEDARQAYLAGKRKHHEGCTI